MCTLRFLPCHALASYAGYAVCMVGPQGHPHPSIQLCRDLELLDSLAPPDWGVIKTETTEESFSEALVLHLLQTDGR